MSDILSQDEVDSLLSGLTTGKIEAETDTGPDPEAVQAYDFARQDQVVRGRMPTFELVNERLAKEMRAGVSSLLHTSVGVGLTATDTMKFSEFTRSLPVPTSLHLFRMEPLRGFALMVLESRLVYNLIDTFFGGRGDGKAKIEGREFTPIETVMIQKVVAACLEALKKAWRPVAVIDTVFVRSEMNPQFATVLLPSDLVIVSRFEVELEQSAGLMTVSLPYAMIEPIRNKLNAGFQSDALEVDQAWVRRVREILHAAMVNFGVTLGATEITGERLIHLRVGDVIQLDNNAEERLTGLVEGVPKFKGFAGSHRGCQAFKVDSRLE
ncbi:MAG: flagellar motor switch protein FliM [Desulfobacterales bacterium]|jgi:flagellar motor switch protein FliM